MKEIVTVTQVFDFDELSSEARDKAIESLSDINTDFDWWDCTYDDINELARRFGLNISIEGFDTYRRNIAVKGDYTYKADGLKQLKDYAPNEGELISLVVQLDALQKTLKPYEEVEDEPREAFLEARLGVNGHCDTTVVSACIEGDNGDADSELEDILREICEVFLSMLIRDYEYRTSREAIIDTIKANEWTFTKDGKMFNE